MKENSQTTSNNLINLKLSQDTLDGLAELGEVLKTIHKRMKAEGFEIKDGTICKIAQPA